MYAAISLTADGIKDRKQILCYPVHNFVYRIAKVKETETLKDANQYKCNDSVNAFCNWHKLFI